MCIIMTMIIKININSSGPRERQSHVPAEKFPIDRPIDCWIGHFNLSLRELQYVAQVQTNYAVIFETFVPFSLPYYVVQMCLVC